MLNYVYVGTSGLTVATRFYDAVLAPLGMRRCITGDAERDRIAAGWGVFDQRGTRELTFWLGRPSHEKAAASGSGTTVVFRAASRQQVDEFHAAVLAHGGSSEGPPGMRQYCDPDFYAAYVRDLDENKLVAYCRRIARRH